MESLIMIVRAKTESKVCTYIYLDDVVITAEKEQLADLQNFYTELKAFLLQAGVVVN